MKVNIGPYPKKDGQDRKISIKIDPYDTWSMDHTLALIIHPMLVQLKNTKHGAPHVDDSEVPEHLRSTAATPLTQEQIDTGSIDNMFFDRWDWVLDEMIWAFEQYCIDDAESQFYSGNPDTMFVPVQVDENGEPTLYSMESGPNDTFKVDWEGLNAWRARQKNAFMLFGKYYQALWD